MSTGKTPEPITSINKAVTQLNDLDLQLTELEAKRDKEMARVRKKYNKQINPLMERMRQLFQGAVFAPAINEENRDALIASAGAKTIALDAGEIRYYRSPNPRLEKAATSAVIKEIRRRRLMRRFTTRKIVVNWQKIKKALKEGTVTLTSVSLVQPEFFRLTLTRTQTALSMDENEKFKREVPEED